MVIFAGIGAAAAGFAASCYWLKRKNLWSEKLRWELPFFNGIVFIVGLWLMVQYDYHILKIIRYLVLMECLILIGIEDKKTKTISNRVLAAMAVFRAILLPVEILCFPDYWNMILWSALAGLLVGGILFLLAFFLSRGGIGMGDVKLMTVLGFYLGSQTLVSSLMFTMIFTVFTGLGMVVIKKASLRMELPFGPFVAAGTIMALLIGF